MREGEGGKEERRRSKLACGEGEVDELVGPLPEAGRHRVGRKRTTLGRSNKKVERNGVEEGRVSRRAVSPADVARWRRMRSGKGGDKSYGGGRRRHSA